MAGVRSMKRALHLLLLATGSTAFHAPLVAPGLGRGGLAASCGPWAGSKAACGISSGFLGPVVGAQRARLGGQRRGNARASGVVGLRAEADYYADLGVARSAGPDDIKKAFRQLARKYHPDVNKAEDAQAKFQEIQQAYEVLSDPQKKSMYDQFGEAGVKGAGAGAGPGFSDFGDFSPFGDIFETFFGGGMGGPGAGRSSRSTGPQQGDDLRLDLNIEFEKAIFGGDEKIRISHLETCDTCEGSGMKPGTSPRTCGTCSGTGVVTRVAKTPLGMLQQQSACPQCQGTGQIIDEYCGSCSGRGRVQNSKQLMITIPPGVDTGSRLRIRSEGDAGPKGGPAGDLYVFLTVKPSKTFTRDGADLYSNVEISYLDAILGCTKTVETVDGNVELKISSGTQPETVMKLDGKGAPKLNDKESRGNHFITVKVQIPTSVSKDEKELLDQLQEKSGKATAGQGFFRK